jgi:8-oxo-dGTP diphosphatase
MTAEAAPKGEQPPKPFCYEYPRPAVTVDLAAFALFGMDLRVLLVRRKHEPFAGRWALPGGFMEMDERIEVAALRELREETGLEVTGWPHPIGVFGDPGRDPRGRTISLAHAAIVRADVAAAAAVAGGDDAAEAAWHDAKECRNLAFDHDAILSTALDWLGRGVVTGSYALKLLPTEFGDGQLKALYRTFGKPPRAAMAWLGKMVRVGGILPAGPHLYRSTVS